MKKFIILILIIFLSGCGIFNSVTPHEQITLSPDERLLEYLPYENYPTLTLKFPAPLNLTNQRQGKFECIFSQNDDFLVSNFIKKLINEYDELDRISFIKTSEKKTKETWMNKKGDKDEKIYIKVKDGYIYSYICFITLENGLQLTINYATFTDDKNIVYYRWSEKESIRMILQYPLMAINEDGKRMFLFLALPNQVRLKFDTTSKKFDLLVNDDKFTESEFYTYDYPNSYQDDYQKIVNYYLDNFEGKFFGDILHYNYLGYSFEITFTNDNFMIKYGGKL